jgi:hypothetical protein
MIDITLPVIGGAIIGVGAYLRRRELILGGVVVTVVGLTTMVKPY